MKNKNRKFNRILTLTIALQLSALVSVQAFGQEVDPAKRFPGYEPSILENDAQVNSVFKKMINRFRKVLPTQCTARAETWSFELDRVQNVKAQKVFVFYTQAYHRYFAQTEGRKFIWWFHVSPYLLVKNNEGKVEERVIDKAFSDAPQTMKEWTDIFIRSKQKCIENVPFASFEGDVTGEGPSYNSEAHCYIVRAPMYDMFPADIDSRERGTKTTMDWDLNQVFFASKALAIGERKEFLQRTGLRD